VARPTATERDRIRKALANHATTSTNLTVTAYAKAAGVKRETARKHIAEMGLPSKNDDPALAADAAALTGAPASPPAAPPTPPPSGPQDPVAQTRAHADRVIAETMRLPAAVAEEVRTVLQEVVSAKGMDAATMAAEAARESVVRKHVENVTAEAGQIYADDVLAGEAMRRFWLERGWSGEFVSPGVLATTALNFWERNRDAVAHLREALEDAQLEVLELRRALDPELRRQAEHEKVWMLVLTAAINGKPIPAEMVAGYLRVVDEVARTDPLPSSPPPALASAGAVG
jgi:hypothetical protein